MMKDYFIYGGQLITSSGVVENTGIMVTRGKIALPGAMRPDSIYSGLACSLGSSSIKRGDSALSFKLKKEAGSLNSVNVDAIQINAEGLYIAPGFIDLHVHGGDGGDVLDGDTSSLRKIIKFHARGGTTSLLPTITSSTREIMINALASVTALYMRKTGGAQILGSHLEGPYLNPRQAGAQSSQHLRPPEALEMEKFILTAEGSLKMITLAPELPGIKEIIKMNTREGVVVSAGHSEATFEEAMAGISAGIRHATHVFNASAPLHHRNPGLLGAVLTSREVTVEAIADSHHLHPSILRLLRETKGKKGVSLVTDAVRAAGMPEGSYDFSGRTIYLKNGRVENQEGRLAGSCLTMIEAVKNAIAAGIPLHEAICMASLNPARVLGIEDQKGVIAPGMDADIIMLGRDLDIKMVMSQGEPLYATIPLED